MGEVFSSAQREDRQKKSVLMALNSWLKAVGSGETDSVASLYADHAVLLPTVKGQICDTPEYRKDYFEHFLAKRPQGEIDVIRVQLLARDIAICSGHYTFAFDNGEVVPARFNFVYQADKDGTMKIVGHHSSVNPERAKGASSAMNCVGCIYTEKLTQKKNESAEVKEVRDALKAWLTAVSSGSTDAVMALYDEDAVLLPTVKGEICDKPELRQKYFNHFLSQQPKGKVDAFRVQELSPEVFICSGHYTFSMRGGEKVPARFNFVYVKDRDGVLKIVNHHSSKNPTPAMKARSNLVCSSHVCKEKWHGHRLEL